MADKWEIVTDSNGRPCSVIVNGMSLSYITRADIQADLAKPVILNLSIMLKDFHVRQDPTKK